MVCRSCKLDHVVLADLPSCIVKSISALLASLCNGHLAQELETEDGTFYLTLYLALCLLTLTILDRQKG